MNFICGGLTYSALENAPVHYETCDHMSSCEEKKSSGKLFCHAGWPEKK